VVISRPQWLLRATKKGRRQDKKGFTNQLKSSELPYSSNFEILKKPDTVGFLPEKHKTGIPVAGSATIQQIPIFSETEILGRIPQFIVSNTYRST
jgi:hypothetical protein